MENDRLSCCTGARLPGRNDSANRMAARKQNAATIHLAWWGAG